MSDSSRALTAITAMQETPNTEPSQQHKLTKPTNPEPSQAPCGTITNKDSPVTPPARPRKRIASSEPGDPTPPKAAKTEKPLEPFGKLPDPPDPYGDSEAFWAAIPPKMREDFWMRAWGRNHAPTYDLSEIPEDDSQPDMDYQHQR